MKPRTILSALFTLFVFTAGYADHYPDLYVIPVAAHTEGVYGTFWRSDVTIHNFSVRLPLTVELSFVATGEGIADNMDSLGEHTIQPQGTVVIRDVLASRLLVPITTTRAGAIIIKGDRQFVVTSRTYVQTPDGGSYGQTVIPVAEFLDAMTGDSDPTIAFGFLPGLSANASSRTNLGFVAGVPEGATEPLVVRVGMVRGDSSSFGAKQFVIRPGTINHVQFSAKDIAGDAEYDSATAYVQIISGDGAVVPYASVVDNTTGDATFVTAQLPPNAPLNKGVVFKQLLEHE